VQRLKHLGHVVSGDEVTIRAKRMMRKIGSPPYEIYGYKTVRVRVA
jgi:hypothetical protein